MPNTLVIPELNVELESIRRDLLKVIGLYAKTTEVNEAVSAAVLQLLDRVDALERAQSLMRKDG